MVKFDDSFTKSRMADLHLEEEERYIQTIAPQRGFDYINLRGYTINPSALGAISEERAKYGNLACFELRQKDLSVAVKDPADPKTQEVLETLVKLRYNPLVYMCSTASLEHAWKRYKDITDSQAKKKGVFEISPEDIASLVKSIKTASDVSETLKKIRGANNSRRISETLELVFAGAVALEASDIHIEPEENGVRLRYRFDGVLHDIADLDSYIYSRLVSRLKLLSGMILNSKAEAQDGRFTFDAIDKEIEIRSSVIPGAFGESVVMRLLDPTLASFSLEKLELNPYLSEAMIQQLKRPNGLIITTGPTGSGKTSALYAFLRVTHKEGVKIITIENPVEYKLEGIVQTQTDEDYTFADGLKAILRQDPDIIMVGEIRDGEVASTAMHAAQTGHLVFSTLHTNSAIAAFPRLMDMGIDPRIMGTSINVILGQRLVRRLCQHCRQQVAATAGERALIEQILATHPHPQQLPATLNLHTAVGCEACGGTGFKGRIGVFEAVIMDQAVEEAVLRDPREHIIKDAAKAQGIPSMVEDGIDKVLAGVTSLAELERMIELPRIATTPTQQTKSPQAEGSSDEDFMSHVV